MVNMAGVTPSALERVCVCLQTVTPENDDAWTGLSQGALTAALAVQSARRRLRTQLSVPFLSPCPGVSLHMSPQVISFLSLLSFPLIDFQM